jgi:crotonobetainyl-CoA:carnitine CoA-transferase CaiB-like acyl-CoA transferase
LSQAAQAGALSDVRVLDMSTVLMGPCATQILADLGADVIKIESLDGDISRQSYPTRSPRMGHSFLNNNRNKRSVALNLKHAEGRAALLALCERADVLVYNARPQAMKRLKLGYEDLKSINPQIIYVGAVGFSEYGRYKGLPAYDDLIQGMVGVPWLSGQASGREPRYAPIAYADKTCAVHLALGVLAALYHRKCTGRGQRVDVPMFEHMVQTLLGEHLEGETFIPARGHIGHRRTLSLERRPYRTKDGYLCTMVYNDKQWRSFFEMIGQPERFEADARFSNQVNRFKNIDAVYGFLSDMLQTRTTEEWLRLFREYDLPVGPMNSLDDVLHDPHLADVGYFKEIAHPTEGTLRTINYPTEFSETPVCSKYPAPRLGEHTVELLTEVGYDRSSIDALIAKGIAAVPR